MALFRRLQALRAVASKLDTGDTLYLFQTSRSNHGKFSNGVELNYWKTSLCPNRGHNAFPWIHRDTVTSQSLTVTQLSFFSNDKRFFSTKIKAPPQARQMGALRISLTSPGFIYEPYAPREKIPFWKRWFTRSGWRRTKQDIFVEMKNAYTIAKLRKSGYTKNQFYREAVDLYQKISTLIAIGDKKSLRKAVTEKMYSELKNEIKLRESKWAAVYWEMIEPAVKIRTLRARMIAVDKNDLNKAFVQLTIELITKQKFEAYDETGTVVAGDKTKEVLVRDIWVFEKSLFHKGAYWRLCGRINLDVR